MRMIGMIALAATLFAAPLLAGNAPARADDAIRVVYHLADERQATLAMHNIGNHLAVAPATKIVVVALSSGVRAFAFGAQDASGRPYSEWVDQFAAHGVEFRICQNSMDALNLDRGDLIDGITVVPSGVAEIARLQAREGYVYIRP
ncbi:MAG TPA: DsrE family protein [Burkholderiales bacterium]